MSEHRLDKIIVERPRKGKIKTPQGAKKYQQTYDDELSSNEPKCRFKTKYLSDNLAPLKRFLFSRVGKPWNDVYSELCRRFDKRTLTGYHLFGHVETLVVQHVKIIDGFPLAKHRLGHRKTRFRLGGGLFYVHPETGILYAFEFSKKNRSKKQCDRLLIDDYHQYRKLDDIWYLVTFAEFKFKEIAFDILLQKKIDSWEMYCQYNRRMYAVHKRHCTKKEIKQILKQLENQK